MASKAELTRCVMIRGGNLGNRPWIVTNVQTIEGVEMICLNKMDAGFARFVSGHRRGELSRMTYLDTLRATRTKATFEACSDGMFDMPDDARAKKAQKQKLSDTGVPDIVEVMLPAVEGHQHEYVKIRSSLDVRNMLWVEMNPNVLDHVAMLMRNSIVDTDEKITIGKGVRWSSDRKAFIARRPSKRMRTFRADGGSDDVLAKDDAKNKALEWASKDRSTSGDEEEGGDDDDDDEGSDP